MSAEARLAPTTFYREIARNRRRGWLLVVIVVVVLGVLGGVIGYATGLGWAGVVLAVGAATVMSIGSFFAGDALVMASSGAREPRSRRDAGPIPAGREHRRGDASRRRAAPSSDLDHRRLRANAFATGRDPEHASVAVTTGLVEKLDREELQGVIGHEMGHIGNLDIRFTLLVGVLVGSIALLSDWFLRFTYWGGGRRSDSDRGGGERPRSSSSSPSSWR